MKSGFVKYGLLFLSTWMIITSCEKDKEEDEKLRIMNEWEGKEIIFPENIPCVSMGKDTLYPKNKEALYKILIYTDSVGCTGCKLDLYQWKRIMKEMDILAGSRVEFLFYFQPQNKKELKHIIQREKFVHPVFIDVEGALQKLNNLPTEEEYQTFLLDQHNKILLVGNPVLHPEVWTLYKNLISGTCMNKNDLQTTVDIKQKVIEVPGMQSGQKKVVKISLENTGKYPLIIQQVNTTCGCLKIKYDKKPITSGEETEIIVEITPVEEGFLEKTVKIFINTKEKMIPVILRGTVTK